MQSKTSFSTHPGYQGIWFALGQVSAYGDKYSGGLGTYTAKHRPLAIYAPAVNKTFFVYGGTRSPDERYLLCMAGVYDHNSGKVCRPVVVHDKNGVDDPHDNPSLAIDEAGHIWVFVSGRNTSRPGQIYKSRLSYDIRDFEHVGTREFTYPQPVWIEGEGFVHCFTKYTGVRELYVNRSDDGRTWTPDIKLAGMGGHYQNTAACGQKVGTMFDRHPEGNVDVRTDLFYAQTTDRGRTWTTVDGQVLNLPLTSPDTPARVHDYSRENRLVYVKDLNWDIDGHPVLLSVTSASHQPGPGGDPRTWEVARWDGGAWQIHKIANSTHNYDTGSLFIEGNLWRVFAPTGTGPQEWGQGGEMAIWESTDQGKSWRKVRDVTSGSERNHGYARRPENAHRDFYTFWADGNPDTLSESHLYFSNREGTVVRELPYTMNGDWEIPVEVNLTKAAGE